MNHQELFKGFVCALRQTDIRYVFMRGYKTLPEKPDTDIDLVCHHEDFDQFEELISKHLVGFHFEDRGFAEYCNMLYHPYHTSGQPNNALPNGHFRVDAQNAFFFYSPMTNYTKHWTVPYAFSELIFETNKTMSIPGHYSFNIPSVECDIALMIMRGVLDGQGNWKQKHMNHVNDLMRVVDKKKLAKVLKIASLASPLEIIKALEEHDFREINKLVLGEK